MAPGVVLQVEEHPVEGLWEALHLQLLTVHCLSGDGTPFREIALVHHRGTFTECAQAFGGSGLMSAVVQGGQCWFTWSWGSGIHRSHAGRITVAGGALVILASGAYRDVDLFVRAGGKGPSVETGTFDHFNAWHQGKPIGTLSIRGMRLELLDPSGRDIAPFFPAAP
jgi:hypothetical protein